jgi:hypothetical protein
MLCKNIPRDSVRRNHHTNSSESFAFDILAGQFSLLREMNSSRPFFKDGALDAACRRVWRIT